MAKNSSTDMWRLGASAMQCWIWSVYQCIDESTSFSSMSRRQAAAPTVYHMHGVLVTKPAPKTERHHGHAHTGSQKLACAQAMQSPVGCMIIVADTCLLYST